MGKKNRLNDNQNLLTAHRKMGKMGKLHVLQNKTYRIMKNLMFYI